MHKYLFIALTLLCVSCSFGPSRASLLEKREKIKAELENLEDEKAYEKYELLTSLGDLNLTLGEYSEGREAFTGSLAALDSAPTSDKLVAERIRALQDLGDTQFLTGKYSEAIASYEKSLDLILALEDIKPPGISAGHAMCGISSCYDRLGEKSKVAESFKENKDKLKRKFRSKS